MRPGAQTHPTTERIAFWVWLVLVLVIFGEAIRSRLSLPSLPFSDPDTWGYLFPSLSSLSGDGFVHTNGRSFPYPLFVYTVLSGFGSFKALSFVQHGLGILSGVVLLWAWHRAAAFFPLSTPTRLLHRVIGLALLTSFLLSEGTLLMEHSIRPESIFPFFTILVPALALEYLLAYPRSRGRAFLFGAALIFNALFVYFLKPAWGLAAGFAILPVFYSFLRIRGAWLWKGCLVILPVALAIAFLWYPEKSLTQEHDPKAPRFLPQLLFSFNAHVIRPILADDLREDATPVYDKELISRVLAVVDRELNANSKAYTSLGYDADNLMYRRKRPDGTTTDSVVSILAEHFGRDIEGFRQFCFHYWKRAWLRYPGQMSYKVANQFSLFYRLKDDPFDRRRRTIEIGPRAERTLKALREIDHEVPLYEAYRRETALLVGSEQVWRQEKLPTSINRFLRPVYPISFALCLGIAGALGVMAWRQRQTLAALKPGWFVLVGPTAVTLYAFSLNVGNCLTVAVVHTMEVSRYVKNQLIFALFAEGCALLLVAVVIDWAVRHRRCCCAKAAAAPGQEGSLKP